MSSSFLAPEQKTWDYHTSPISEKSTPVIALDDYARETGPKRTAFGWDLPLE